jgi:hypothetical protein
MTTPQQFRELLPYAALLSPSLLQSQDGIQALAIHRVTDNYRKRSTAAEQGQFTSMFQMKTVDTYRCPPTIYLVGIGPFIVHPFLDKSKPGIPGVHFRDCSRLRVKPGKGNQPVGDVRSLVVVIKSTRPVHHNAWPQL